jgi:hypothetical protein
MIDPLDALGVRGIGPGELGLVIGPTSRGKSLALTYFAYAYARQAFSPLYFTLEDPREQMESRLDALITSTPMQKLVEEQEETAARFSRFRNYVTSRFRIVDGTMERYTVEAIEKVVQKERELGFPPDAIFIDYDAYLVSAQRNKEKRFDSDEIYLSLQLLAARNKVMVWTAAQTQRNTKHLKVLSEDRIAEDFGKVRKTTLAISIGQGEWGTDSFYLWVCKNKFGFKDVGCHIVPDLESATFYDQDKTRLAAARNDGKKAAAAVEDEDEYVAK